MFAAIRSVLLAKSKHGMKCSHWLMGIAGGEQNNEQQRVIIFFIARQTGLSEFISCRFKRLYRNAKLAIFNPAFQFDRVTPADPLLQLANRKLHSTIAAGNTTALIAESLFMRITAGAGVEKGEDPVLDLDQKETYVLAPIEVGIEFRHLRLERSYINDDCRSALRRRRVDGLARAGNEQQINKS